MSAQDVHHHNTTIKDNVVFASKHAESLHSHIDQEMDMSIDEDPSVIIGETSYIAWIQVIVYLGISCCCEYSWITVSCIPIAASEWMGISLTQLNWIANTSAIFDTIFSLFAACFYERYGIKKSIILAGIINSVGSWIKCIAILLPVERRYVIVLIGEAVSGAGGPLVFNIGAKLVSVWFATKDRGIAINILAIGIGKITGPILIPRLAPSEMEVPKLLIILASISSVCTLPAFLVPRKPKITPSLSADKTRAPFWIGVRQISGNIQFWWLVIVSSVSIGLNLAMSTLLIEIIVPYGYTEKQGGLIVSLKEISGFIGGALSGYWLGQTGQHLMLLKFYVPISVFTGIALIFQIIPNSYATIVIGCMQYGFFSRGALPVFFELASELTYPVSESIASGIIWTFSTINSLIFVVALDALRSGPDSNPPSNMKSSTIAAAVILAVGSFPCLWINGDLKRLKVDNEHSQKRHKVEQTTV